MIVAATGHRPDKLGGYSKDVSRRLRTMAADFMRARKPTKVISGMALGWDQAWAEAAIELHIPFIAAVPFAGQERRWPESSQSLYRTTIGYADEIVTIGDYYSAGAMQKRNEWMVDNSDLVVALWDGSFGGTCNCLAYLDKKKKRYVNLWPQWSGDFEAMFD